MGYLVPIAGAIVAGVGYVGSAVGGFLAAYGSTLLTVVSIGASVALSFLGPSGPNVEGPRLNDLKVQTSTYGSPIPRAFGRVRIAGNMVWATDIQEVRRRDSVGGKGGGGGHITTYEYFGNFAIMFAEGPAIAVSRIWANKKLIYDKTGATGRKQKYQFSPIRAYMGDSTQVPDPLIEADLGSANTPAFRGRVYIVFESLPLLDFGNRMPAIEAEIQFKTPVTTSTTTLASLDDTNAPYMIEQDSMLYLYGIKRERIAPNDYWRMFRYDLLDDVLAKEAPIAFTSSLFPGTNPMWKRVEAVLPGDDDRVLAVGRIDNPTEQKYQLIEVNPFTFDVIGHWDMKDILSLTGGTVLPCACHTWTFQTAGGVEVFSLVYIYGGNLFNYTGGLSDNNRIILINRRGLVPGGQSGIQQLKLSDKESSIVISSVADDADGSLWLVGWPLNQDGGPTGDRDAKMFKVTPVLFPDDVEGSIFVPQVEEIDLVDLDPDGKIHQPLGVVYDRGTHKLTIFGQPAPGTGEVTIARYDIDTGAFDQIMRTTDAGLYFDSGEAFDEGTLGGTLTLGPLLNYLKKGTDDQGKIIYPCHDTVTNASGWVELDTRGWTFTKNVDGPRIDTFKGTYWHKDSDSVFQFESANSPGLDVPLRYFRSVVQGGGTALDEVLQDITEEGGFQNARFEADASLAALTVQGYVMAQQSPPRAHIEPLAFTYLFGAVESDGKIKFRPRAQASIRTIPDDDLGVKPGDKSDPDKLLAERVLETELPRKVSVRYLDIDREYQEGSQYAARMANPKPTQQSDSVVSQNLPLVMQGQDAKRSAEANLYAAWAGRVGYQLALGPKHADLEPLDVVTVTKPDGSLVPVRIEKTDLLEAFTSDMTTVLDEESAYTVMSPAADLSVSSQVIPHPGPTQAFLMDVPLMRDADSTPGRSGVYVAMGGIRSDWTAGVITKSEAGNQGPFESWESSKGAHEWGHLNTALAVVSDEEADDGRTQHFDDSLTTWDDTTQVVVSLVSSGGTLSSKTDLEVLNGANAVMLLHPTDAQRFELLHFANVSVSGGVATLTRLLRGRRGTEQNAARGFATGTRVVFLDPDVTTRRALELSTDLGVEKLYRAESSGEDESTKVFGFTLNANDLRPYPVDPVYVDLEPGSRSASTITITWERRTRLGAEDDLMDETTAIPLGEESEAYEVDLLDSGAETVSTTKSTSSDATGVQFTVSERTTAGYTNDEAVRVKIYQKSAIAAVGRGLYRDVTI